MKILLTNDDSHESPLLSFIIEKLQTLGELFIVVPKQEQSWKGKSITCYGTLHLGELELHGHKAFWFDGTPADCVNLGIYNLCDGKPDLLVSGINVGLNAGLSFAYSSGTLGACFEANIAGVPAVALSQQFDPEIFRGYVTEYILPTEVIERLRIQTSRLLDLLFEGFLLTERLLDEPITWSFNFPYEAQEDVKLEFTPLGQSYYQGLFKRNESGFEHQAVIDVEEDPRPQSDIQMVVSGKFIGTPIDIRALGQIDNASVQRMCEEFASNVNAAGGLKCIRN